MKLSDINPSKNIKLLAYGDSGSGKTCLAASFPTPMYIADFDNKVASAASFYKGEEFLSAIETDSYQPDPTIAQDLPFRRFEQKLLDIEKSVLTDNFKYQTIVIDSITTYCDELLKYIVKTQTALKGPMPGVAGLQHYMLMNNKFKNLLSRILSLPANIVMTAHIQLTKDESTGEIVREPLISGKLPAYLPIMFEEVYRTFTKDDKGTLKYLMQTKPSARFSRIRSQIKNLPAEIPTNYCSIKEYL